jgi:hypothetical protein
VFCNEQKQEDRQKASSAIINLEIEDKLPICPGNFLFVFSEEEIARQLTLVDFDIYRAIQPAELLNQAWNKPKYRHRAKNVLQTIARSNAMTLWVSSVILWQSTLKSRVRILIKLITIADHLRKLNNFNSLMAILAGINSAAVYRLKWTISQLPEQSQQILQSLNELMHPSQAYANYRNAIHEANPPCVPFLGTYLTDITFIEDGNPDYIKGLINYRKRELVFLVIREIQQYQQKRYSYELVDSIAYFLTELPYNNTSELYDLSLVQEPRSVTSIDELS